MEFNWKLPVAWCQAGLPQGNGLFGALMWGDNATLKFTFNRADYWFYGENLPPSEEQSYENLKRLLAAGNESEIKRIFGGLSPDGQWPQPSSRLPMGRLEVKLPSGMAGGLRLDTNSSLGRWRDAGGNLEIESLVPRKTPLLALRVSGSKYRQCVFSVRGTDSPEIAEFYRKNRFPDRCESALSNWRSGGWIQEIPGAKPLGVYWKIEEKTDHLELFLTAVRGGCVFETEGNARGLLEAAAAAGFSRLAEETARWWRNYWEKVPKIKTPDWEINELYRSGMYRLAGLCAPDAPAATLQGPWVEDDRMPPWSCDYHFNINIQECCWPVFSGNVPEFILPLFEMIRGWKPKLREYAQNFVHIPDGQMLPHATDDRGTGLGGFWPGHIDHSCTAWAAQLMWLYWKYAGDEDFLKNTLYPFMDGVMNVYAAMLEKDADGNFFLAAESSPEYNENRIDAWGRNPAVHLAAIHFLANCLLETADRVDSSRKKRELWTEIIAKLPRAPVSAEGELCIWDGQPLAEPHRHFSHLAALHPFDLLDWRNSEHDAALVARSISKWITQGTGLWAGWSFPWASIIYSRLEMPEAAHTMLSMFRRAFMKDDYALRYLPGKACFTSVAGPTGKLIMQIEAGMASAAAVMEMCVHCSRGVLYPFAGIPAYWADISFAGIRTEGAFLVSGLKAGGEVKTITVKAERDGILKIALPHGRFRIKRNDGKAAELTENLYTVSLFA
ncbi:MAG: hypothetical protein PHV82_02910, partial [Victivallaceae bacterium]|nr:hypothetical protein [Victivallaceae bacterium]